MIVRVMAVLGVGVALVACSSDEASQPALRVATSLASPSSTNSTTTTTTVAPSLDSAAGLAAELSLVEGALRDDTTSADDLPSLGRRQQLAYRAMNRHPEWHATLLELLDPIAVPPVEYHLAAWRAWRDHSAGSTPSDPPSELPAWTIVEPLPADELLGYYREAEALTGIPWSYLAAIHFQETRMGRINGVSSAGAVGPMQFLPSTWDECCEGDPTVARDAIIGAARYLVMRGGLDDIRGALYGYNPNDGYVGAVSAYAENMAADPRAYFGYHGWQVFFGSSEGTIRLPVGYSYDEPVPASAYVAEHPDDLVP